jgi:hypothetical protein
MQYYTTGGWGAQITHVGVAQTVREPDYGHLSCRTNLTLVRVARGPYSTIYDPSKTYSPMTNRKSGVKFMTRLNSVTQWDVETVLLKISHTLNIPRLATLASEWTSTQAIIIRQQCATRTSSLCKLVGGVFLKAIKLVGECRFVCFKCKDRLSGADIELLDDIPRTPTIPPLYTKIICNNF